MRMMESLFSPFPVIGTQRLLLRQLHGTDADDVFFLRSDASVMRYIDRPPAKTVAEASDYIAMVNRKVDEAVLVLWGITFPGADIVIGTLCFFNLDNEHFRGEVGYMLHPDFHRQGIMKEAMEAALRYGFGTMKMHTITATVNPENDASIGLLTSLGFSREGYFRESYYFNGRFLDSAVYTLIAP